MTGYNSPNRVLLSLGGQSAAMQVSPQLNSWMRAFLREEEIKYSLFSMPQGKDTGPDNITVDILQHCWSMVKNNIIVVTLFFFQNYYMLRSLNHTFITVIPKKPELSTLDDYRSISCVGTLVQDDCKDLSISARRYATKFHLQEPDKFSQIKEY